MMNIYQVLACIVAVLIANGVYAISLGVFHILNKFIKVKDLSWLLGTLALIVNLSLVAYYGRFL